MVDKTTLISIRNYLQAVNTFGIPISFGILFGSHVTGSTHEWSDIDLVVVSPQFDVERSFKSVSNLWIVAAKVDSRIEPIACGVKQWEEDDSSAIIEIARREGVIIYATEVHTEVD